MPRLHVWCIGGALCASTVYFYKNHFVLYSEKMQAFERGIEIEKQPVIQLLQGIAELKAVVENQLQTNLMYGRIGNRTHSLERPFSSCWATNREKIGFFLRIQELRALLLNVKKTRVTTATQNEREMQGLLRDLNDLEFQHCNELQFREEKPAIWQKALCLGCFCLYIGVIKCIFQATVWMYALTGIKRLQELSFYMNVGTAKLIMNRLEIDCEAHVGTVSLNKLEENTAINRLCIFPCQHWIEEAGLWAALGQLGYKPSDVNVAVYRSNEKCLSFGEYFQLRMSQKFDVPFTSLDGCFPMSDASSGYPLVPKLKDENQSFVYVSTYGLTDVLYMEDDSKTQGKFHGNAKNKSKQAVYEYIQNQQYSSVREQAGNSKSGERHDVQGDAMTSHGSGKVSTLVRPLVKNKEHIFPLLSLDSCCNVYGGRQPLRRASREGAARNNRTLSFYFEFERGNSNISSNSKGDDDSFVRACLDGLKNGMRFV